MIHAEDLDLARSLMLGTAILKEPEPGKRVVNSEGKVIGTVQTAIPVPENRTEADDQRVILDALNGAHAEVMEEIRNLLDATGTLAETAAAARRDISPTSIRSREAIETRLAELRNEMDENLALVGKGMATLGGPELKDFRRLVANQIADIELTFLDQDTAEE